MNYFDNARFFLFERFYYEHNHDLKKLKKFNNRLISDRIYNYDGTLLRKCVLKYLIDKPNLKIIEVDDNGKNEI
ncbi:MAG: hypothetical protein PHC34_01625 [Candidatus Gastranaerophilales bacterium]|nr:hypothetical protein [Candidatus Gastranaerophilales bacterium]